MTDTKNYDTTAISASQPAVTVAATFAALVFGSIVMLFVTVGQLVA